MSELHMLRPWWLLIAPLGLALVAWAWRRSGDAGPWRNQCDATLLGRLAVRGRVGLPALAPLVAGAGVIVGSLALAGPSWSRVEQPVFRSDRAVVVAIDLSRSMDATDLAPSRLARARFKIADLLERSGDGQTGLVAYAGAAFVVAPLTDDDATLRNLLPALTTDLMPAQGSRADLGLARAGELLAGAGAEGAEVVLVSDGVSDPRAARAARELARAGHRVSVLAVGSTRGAPVPLPEGGFLTDRDGNIVVPGLDAAGLAEVARAGGGVLTPLTLDDADLQVLEPGAGRGARDASRRTTERWEDGGPWLVLALLPLAALGFRRGWLVALAALSVLPPVPAHALGPEALWSRPDQRAAAALSRGDADAAARVAPDARWQGPAQYRAEQYDAAAAAYRALPGAEARYNEGNALARAGRLREALAAYTRALEVHPEHDDAAHNRALVERALQSEAGRSPPGQGESPPPGESSADQGRTAPGAARDDGEQDRRPGSQARAPDATSSGGGDETTGTPTSRQGADDGAVRDEPGDGTERAAGDPEPERPGEEPPPGTPGEAGADAEAQQAMEQWMRRVPDDPGGLLRRKFALEHQRRGGAGAEGPAW